MSRHLLSPVNRSTDAPPRRGSVCSETLGASALALCAATASKRVSSKRIIFSWGLLRLGFVFNQPRLRLALIFRLGSTEGFAVVARLIETTDTSLPASKHVAGIGNSLHPGFRLLGGRNPVNPVQSCNGCRVIPNGARFRTGRKRCQQIRWNLGFWLMLHRRNVQLDDVANFHACGFAQLLADLQPMAQPTIRLQRGLETVAIDGSFYRRSSSSRKRFARVLGQNDERPRSIVTRLYWAK